MLFFEKKHTLRKTSLIMDEVSHKHFAKDPLQHRVNSEYIQTEITSIILQYF